MWMLLFALIGMWIVGSIAATSFTTAVVLLIALAFAVLAIQYWESQHRA